jgi:hypothetical protein
VDGTEAQAGVGAVGQDPGVALERLGLGEDGLVLLEEGS